MLAVFKILPLLVALAMPWGNIGWGGEAQNAFNDGVKHYQAGRFKEAVAAYDRAIKASPDASEAYNNRGLAYHKLGQTGNALKDYDQAVKLNPNFTDAVYNRGNALLAQKQYERAI
ncbi:MAG TPA: tetratricopeptide repeat protein, partial [Candidatus Binatia bacterium]|nr:tetratricopeptide repeat protein [Candidatus Binatia bacterium]